MPSWLELVDAPGLGPGVERRGGSTPLEGTRAVLMSDQHLNNYSYII